MSTFAKDTGKTIQQAFEEFDRANPIVYNYVKQLAFKAINFGIKKMSIRTIMEVIRWKMLFTVCEPNPGITIKGERRKFKINANFEGRYIRKFVAEFPEHSDKFETRELKA